MELINLFTDKEIQEILENRSYELKSDTMKTSDEVHRGIWEDRTFSITRIFKDGKEVLKTPIEDKPIENYYVGPGDAESANRWDTGMYKDFNWPRTYFNRMYLEKQIKITIFPELTNKHSIIE